MGSPAALEKVMKFSLLRRLFHISGVIIPISYLLWGKLTALVLATGLLVLLSVAEVLRLTGVLDSPLVKRQLKEKEMDRPTGSLFYVGGCLLTILVFSKPVAVASILVLIVSDPLASLIGSRWGKRFLLGKSLEGTGTFFLSSILILECFSFKAHAVLAAACAGTAAELLSSRFLDDNLSIPLVTAIALTILN